MNLDPAAAVDSALGELLLCCRVHDLGDRLRRIADGRLNGAQELALATFDSERSPEELLRAVRAAAMRRLCERAMSGC